MGIGRCVAAPDVHRATRQWLLTKASFDVPTDKADPNDGSGHKGQHMSNASDTAPSSAAVDASAAGVRPMLDLSDGGSSQRASVRHGIWAALFVYMAFSVTDYLLIPDVALYTTISRAGICAFVITLFELKYRAGARLEQLNYICAFGFVGSYVAWLGPAMMTGYTESLSYYMIFGAIFMMGVNLFFSFKFSLSILASSIVLAIFFVAIFIFPGSAPTRGGELGR